MTRRSGLEYKTGARAGILSYLKESGQRPVSVSEIHAHMQSANHPVNVTTIYRYLEKLEADGNLIKYMPQANGESTKATYQYVERTHKCDEHLHLKCVAGGVVEHLDCHFMEEIASHVAKDHGFQLQCKNSVIYGFCAGCRREKAVIEK